MRARVHPRALMPTLMALALTACSQAPAPVAPVAAASQAPAAATAATASDAPVPTAAQQEAWTALLHRLDRDGDGVISRSEHTVAAAMMFSRMDRDGDDVVTVEEMDREREEVLDAAPTDTAKRLADVDGNHDGSLDSREHDTATGVIFDRYDRNGDTRLVRAEFIEVLAKLEAANPGAKQPPATAADAVN